MRARYLFHGQVDTWVAKSAPGWMAVRTVMQDVVSALAHLHVKGIVHADVKPANILVGLDERGKLADFDISVDSGNLSSGCGGRLLGRLSGAGCGFWLSVPAC